MWLVLAPSSLIRLSTLPCISPTHSHLQKERLGILEKGQLFFKAFSSETRLKWTGKTGLLCAFVE